MFCPTNKAELGPGSTHSLIATDWDPIKFRMKMGPPFPGWSTNVFNFMTPEWQWRDSESREFIRAGVVNNRVVLAFSTPDTLYKFLAFVEQKFKAPVLTKEG